MKLRKLLVWFLCSSVLVAGCSTRYIKGEKARVSDELLEDLARDLAEINMMVEDTREGYRKEGKITTVRVLEAWHPAERKVTKVGTIIAKSKIEVPKTEGFTVAEVFKGIDVDRKAKFIGVRSAAGPWYADIQAGIPREYKVADYPIRFYSAALADDPKSFSAITEYVSFLSRLEKAADRILKKLNQVKKKYEDSAVYIEGFVVHLPWIEVEIQFKFKM